MKQDIQQKYMDNYFLTHSSKLLKKANAKNFCKKLEKMIYISIHYFFISVRWTKQKSPSDIEVQRLVGVWHSLKFSWSFWIHRTYKTLYQLRSHLKANITLQGSKEIKRRKQKFIIQNGLAKERKDERKAYPFPSSYLSIQYPRVK